MSHEVIITWRNGSRDTERFPSVFALFRKFNSEELDNVNINVVSVSLNRCGYYNSYNFYIFRAK